MPIPLLRILLLAATLTAPALPTPAVAALDNDYPSAAIAEYVYACMKANGETAPVLAECSCSVDVVASLLTYDRYVEASTYLSMMQLQGDNGGIFRSSAESKASVQELRRAQAEGDVRCFNSN